MARAVEEPVVVSAKESTAGGVVMTSAADARSEMVHISILGIVLRHARLVIGCVVGSAFLLALLAVIQGHVFVAESSFRPQGTGDSSVRLSSLAAQLGFGIPSLSGEPLQFYARLVRSRSLLDATVASEYDIADEAAPGGRRRGNLIELYQIEAETEAKRLAAAASALEKRIEVAVHLDAGMIVLRVRGSDPELVTQVNRRLLDLINSFNIEHRQSQARAEKEFVEARYREAGQDLTIAEDAMKRFLERNRSYRSSPELSFEAARLQRQVDLRQQVYATLAQAYEQASIEEVRNTPVVTTVDPPEGSAKEESYLLRNLVIGVGIGAMAAIVIMASMEYVVRLRVVSPEQYEQLRKDTQRLKALVTRDPERSKSRPGTTRSNRRRT